MIYQISVPGVVADVEEIRVLEWHGALQQRFEPGDLIVELETHKALVEVRAGQAGVLRQILVAPGEWRAIGLALCLLSDTPEEVLPQTVDAIPNLAVEFDVS